MHPVERYLEVFEAQQAAMSARMAACSTVAISASS